MLALAVSSILKSLMYNKRLLVISFVLGCMFEQHSIFATNKLALVIGNAKYGNNTHPTATDNANRAAAAFENAGFTVILEQDLTDFRRTVESFTSKGSTGGVLAFYFAGYAGKYPSKQSKTIVGEDGKKKKEYYYINESGLASSKSPYWFKDLARTFAQRSRARLNLFFFDSNTPDTKLKPELQVPEFPNVQRAFPGGMIASSFAGKSEANLSEALLQHFSKRSQTMAEFVKAANLPDVEWSCGVAKQQVLQDSSKITVSLKPPANPKSGDQWQNSAGITFCWCPPGAFTMGIPNASSQPHTRDAEPVEATISKGFWISKYEITFGDYGKVRSRSSIPSNDENVLAPHANVPMISIKGPQASGFGKEMIKYATKEKSLPNGWTFRLPSEAEWEYACRAGSKTLFHFGDSEANIDKYANCADKALFEDDDAFYCSVSEINEHNGKRPAQVGSYLPNAWGIHDMHGNVAEWVGDPYSPKLLGGTDPRPKVEKAGSLVVKGGAWCSTPETCQSGYRNRSRNNNNGGNASWLGFRIVLAQK